MTEETPTPPPVPPPEPAIEVVATPASAEDASGPTVDAPPPQPSPPVAGSPDPPPLASPPPLRRPWSEHVWAAVCHLLLFLVIPTVFLGAVITFFVWQVFGKKDAQVEDQGREALNFQINVALLSLVFAATFIGLPLVIVLWVIACVVCLIAALHASRGERYRYPAILRIVSH